MHWLRRLFSVSDPLAHYRQRENQADVWTNRYPDCAAEALRFLEIINGAFLLSRSMKDKINPDDEIMRLYQASMVGRLADDMELEHLFFMTEDAFLCKFPREFNLEGMTFGDFFEQACKLAT